MKRKSAYATMKISELAQITRERGLKKPKVLTRSEWASYLDADDAKREKQAAKADVAEVISDEDAANVLDAENEETEETDAARKTSTSNVDIDTLKAPKRTTRKEKP